MPTLNRVKIFLLMADNDLNQSDICRFGGISKSTLSDILSGKRKPKPSTVKKIANGLGVGIEEIIG